MGKSLMIGNASGKAAKGKKGFIGDSSGKARKIKKMWVGDASGIARLFFSGELALKYLGFTTPLSVARASTSAAAVGNYALFAGGFPYASSANSRTLSAVVDTYDGALTKSTATSLTRSCWGCGTATVGDYALFAGGTVDVGGASGATSLANAYNSSMTKVSVDSMSVKRYATSAASVGNYALFAGGYSATGTSYRLSSLDAYNTSLTRSTPSSTLSSYTSSKCGVSTGKHAIFAAGYPSNFEVDAFDASLTKTVATKLTTSDACGTGVAGTSISGHAILVGGNYSYESKTGVTVYDSSLTKSTLDPLPEGREGMEATSVGGYAIFAGGTWYDEDDDDDYERYDAYIYDSSFTRTVITPIGSPARGMSAATVGNYALFAGGGLWNTASSAVKAFQVS